MQYLFILSFDIEEESNNVISRHLSSNAADCVLSRFVLFLRPRAAAVRRLLNNQAEHCSRDMSTKASGLNGLSRSLLRMIVTPATHVSQRHQHHWDNQHCTSLFELDQSSTRALALPDFHQGGSASRFPGSQTLSICTSSHPPRLLSSLARQATSRSNH